MGLFSTLSVGTRGLFAAQLGMDISGQNISNADVEGYSRKRLNMTADYRYDGSYGQMGFGVDVINIDRLRDTMIDKQIQRQNQGVGYYDVIDNALEQIENIFTEPGDTGLLSFIDQFFNAWHNLADNPSDLSARTMVRANAEILTDVFHNLSGELRALKDNLNEKISRNVERVNTLAQEIFNFNTEIGRVELGSQNANDSRDSRDRALKELANLIDIDVNENDQGQVTITSNGNILVSPADYRTLEMTTSTFSRPDGTSERNVGIRFADTKREYMPLGGQINGMFEARDNIAPQYIEYLDTLANNLVSKVNDLHEQGYNLYGLTGINFFDTLSTGASDIALSTAITSDVQNIAAASGGAAQPATQVAISAGQLTFGTGAQTLSVGLGRLWATGDPNLERARNITNGSVLVRTATGTTLQENVDYHVDYNNGTIQMLHSGYDTVDLTVDFQYRTGDYAGPGDNSMAVRIAQLRDEATMVPDALGNETNTFTQYYSAFIGRLGLARNEAEANLDSRTFLIGQYERHQDSISGVSLDEEMAEIIKYQHTYTAAARVISTASQMIEVLMNM